KSLNFLLLDTVENYNIPREYKISIIDVSYCLTYVINLSSVCGIIFNASKKSPVLIEADKTLNIVTKNKNKYSRFIIHCYYYYYYYYLSLFLLLLLLLLLLLSLLLIIIMFITIIIVLLSLLSIINC
ncbi:hypothetical protein WUBG_04115, partial [Wuchereria bancrofti]